MQRLVPAYRPGPLSRGSAAQRAGSAHAWDAVQRSAQAELHTCRSLDTSLVPRYAGRWLSKSSSSGVSGSDAIRQGGRLRRRRQRGASAAAGWVRLARIADSHATICNPESAALPRLVAGGVTLLTVHLAAVARLLRAGMEGPSCYQIEIKVVVKHTRRPWINSRTIIEHLNLAAGLGVIAPCWRCIHRQPCEGL